MKSVQKFDVKTTELLIKSGANINATNEVGDSALSIAASNSKKQFRSKLT